MSTVYQPNSSTHSEGPWFKARVNHTCKSRATSWLVYKKMPKSRRAPLRNACLEPPDWAANRFLPGIPSTLQRNISFMLVKMPRYNRNRLRWWVRISVHQWVLLGFSFPSKWSSPFSIDCNLGSSMPDLEIATSMISALLWRFQSINQPELMVFTRPYIYKLACIHSSAFWGTLSN